MKNTKYYVRNISLVAVVLALAFYGKSKLRTSPYRDKDTYGVVYETHAQDYHIDKLLKLDNGETIAVHSDIPREPHWVYEGVFWGPQLYDKEVQNYKIGDTVWFHYDQHTEAFAEVFPENVIKEPSKQVKDVIHQQTIRAQKTR